MSEDAAYARKMQAMLAEWPDRTALMESRAPAIPAERRPLYQDLVGQMRSRHGDCVRALEDFRPVVGRPDAAAARRRLEQAWAALTSAYEKALCQFEGVKN